VHQAAVPETSGASDKLPHAHEIQNNTGGYDISNVQAHTSGPAAEANRAMGADAWTPYAAPVQMRAPDGGTPGGTTSVHQAAAHGISGGGGKLPDADKIQKSFGGHDISNIQAHTSVPAAEASRAMGADAYATGNHVVLGEGGQGLHTQAHEAAHIVQQRAGVALSRGVGQAGDAYEKHADAVADAVVQGKSAEGLLGEVSDHDGGLAAVQMSPDSSPQWCEGATSDADQASMLESTQSCAASGAPFTQTPEPTPAGSEPTAQTGTTAQHPTTATTANTVQGPTNASEAPTGARGEIVVPPMPLVFDQESVLATWIALFNTSLHGSPLKVSKLRQLTGVNWADADGLSLAKLKAAAANWQAPAGGTQGVGAAGGQAGLAGATPPGAETTRILMMMASSNHLFRKVFDTGYYEKCLQFSVQFMKDLGAKRADGSDADGEKRKSATGPLTTAYRGEPLSALPTTLPAGYQICIVSRPDWGFTEVGNHWFLSAGGGYFLDGTSGVFNAEGMTQNLVKATAAQWARRVMDKDRNALRIKMADKFLAEDEKTRKFQQYLSVGRRDTQKEERTKTKTNGRWAEGSNPEFMPPSAKEADGKAAIEDFVKRDDLYHPKIWLVEPTTRVTTP